MERISRFRAAVLLSFFGVILALYAWKLFDLQIIQTDGNTDNTATYTTITTVRAARGDLLDRNGKVMVGNRASYDLVFNHYVIKSSDGTNEYLYRLYQKCQELGIAYLDHFPITKTRPFEYTLDDYSTAWQRYFRAFMQDYELDSDMTAPLLMETLRDRYKIPTEWDDESARAVVGMRYEFDLRGVTSLPTYTFIEDVSDENLSALLELNTPGLMVESSTVREYHTTYAAHILGYLGGMDADDWAIYQDQGYSMDAYIGQDGMEEAFEEYLHGIDGQRVDVVSKDGTIISQYWRTDKSTGEVYSPKAGNNVETTIDLDIQMVAEDSLAEFMENVTDPEVNTRPGDEEGHDAEGAAVVVMKVKTGEILACASYPTYNLATMHEDWDEIEADSRNPFFNRAFGAYYAPGSTYKMCTLVSAMEHIAPSTGEYVLKYGETIEDKGRLDEESLGNFHPTCLVWSSNPGVTHGMLDGSQALMVSCNYFFYILGYRLTADMIDETAKGFGLGEPTGIELTEKIGWRSNQESKTANYTGTNQRYTAGDRILSAIGQAENRFTPLQLCVYACTLANQGTRYKATFLSRVVSSDYHTLVEDNEPEILSKMSISDLTYQTYMSGMRKVVTADPTYNVAFGTASSFFGGPTDKYGFDDTVWPIQDGVWSLKDEVVVYAKTGTAEHASGGSDHAAFLCFAHRVGETEPEIAIAIYGEKAAHGAWLAPIAEDILEVYFEQVNASDVFTYENQIG
ncbi:MAG: hypothetical protein IJ001_00015 [Oscillospiraceae bacterium]|nr:hypothetical protein [Oscillospiraceae bacterium]